MLTETNATITRPDGKVIYGATSSSATELDLTLPNGQVALGIFELDYGPVSLFLTWALSNPGVSTYPASFQAAMSSTTATVYNFIQIKQ